MQRDHSKSGGAALGAAFIWTLGYLLLAAPVVLGSQIGGGVLGQKVAPWIQPLFQGGASIAGVLLLTWCMWTKGNRKSWRDVGMPASDLALLFEGIAIGVACILSVAAIELTTGWLQLSHLDMMPRHQVPKWLLLALAIIPSIGVGLTEELAFRGYIFAIFAERGPLWLAASLSSLLWAAMHFTLGGFGAGFVITVTAMGFLFVALRLYTGSLWLPIGFHAAWDYTQTYLVGLSTTGAHHDPALVQIRQLGPTFWVGEPPAIEGGALFTLVIFACLGATATLAARKLKRSGSRDGYSAAQGFAQAVDQLA